MVGAVRSVALGLGAWKLAQKLKKRCVRHLNVIVGIDALFGIMDALQDHLGLKMSVTSASTGGEGGKPWTGTYKIVH